MIVPVIHNPKNNFTVATIHFSLDPEKNTPEWIAESQKGLIGADGKPTPGWYREYDINYEYFAGKVFYPEFRQYNIAKEPIPYKERETLYRGWDYGFHRPCCYDGETEILTYSGWKLFSDVIDDEVVLTLNTSNGEMEYQKILAKIQYKFTGDMYHWYFGHNTSCDIRVTDNHFMLGWNRHFKRYDFRQARDIGNIRFNTPTTGEWKGTTLRSPIEGISSMDYCRLMGIWLSEGSLGSSLSRPGGERKGRHYNILIWQKNNDLKISDLLDRLPIKFSRLTKDKGGWVGASKELYYYLLQFGKSGEKFIPQIIKDSDREHQKCFLDFYELGDGSKVNGKIALVTTKSKKMADDLQEIYAKIGISSRVKKIGRHKSIFGNEERYFECYEVRKNVNYRIGLVKKNLTIEKVKDEDVYCVMVPNHTVFVRRKQGRAVFCGNCLITRINEIDQWSLMKVILGEDEDIKAFGLRVRNFCLSEYPGAKYIDADDIAGMQVNDKSQVTSRQMLNLIGIYPTGRKQEIAEGATIIRNKLKLRIDGQPGLLVDPREQYLIDLFKGGCHYPEVKEGMPQKEEYYDDPYFSHGADAMRYIATEMFNLVGQHQMQNQFMGSPQFRDKIDILRPTTRMPQDDGGISDALGVSMGEDMI